MPKVKFSVMTDFHYEHIPDGQWRLREFLKRACDEEVDFIIQLGDFCRPTGQNRRLQQMLNQSGRPVYHSIGNHDTDDSPKEAMVTWLHMKNAYYAFNCGAVRFIVLDANFIGYEGKVVPYSRAQNKAKPGAYPYLPGEELHWLEAQLSDCSLPVIIFSHHSLENNHGKRGVSNRNAVQDIISRFAERGGKILCCINGHDHADSLEIFRNVYYLTVNSISYKYLEFESLGVADEVKNRYPELQDMIPYDTPLSAVLTVHDNLDVEVSGMEGHFSYGFSPREFGIARWDNRPVTAGIQSRVLRYRPNNGK